MMRHALPVFVLAAGAVGLSAGAWAAPGASAYAFSAAGESRCATFGPTAPLRDSLLAGVVSVGTPGPGCSVLESLQYNPAASGGIANASAAAAAGPFGTQFGVGGTNGASASRAASGILGAQAKSIYSGASDAFTVRGAEAFGVFTESVSLGTVGGPDSYFHPTFTVDGSMSLAGRGQGQILLAYQKDAGPQYTAFSTMVGDPLANPIVSVFNGFSQSQIAPLGFTLSPGRASGSADISFYVPMTAGVRFDLTVTLFASALTSADTGFPGPSVTETDFLTTAKLTHIDVLDSAFQPISNFTIQTGSGAIYTQNGVQISAVPEPSMWALLLMGLAGVGGLAQRSKRRDR